MGGDKPWENGGKPKPKKNLKKKTKTRRQKMAEKEANKQFDKVEVIKYLEKKFEMSKIDALVQYDKFHSIYPSGEIKKEDFLEENKVCFATKGT